MSNIPLSEPWLNGNEWAYLKECLDTNWVSSAGPFVERFEQAIKRQCRSAHAVPLISGTAALHLGLQVAGVQAGDYVIVSDMSFVASVNAIRYLGAKPILIDVQADTWQMDHELLAQKLESETELREEGCYWPAGKGYIRALLPVHILGGSCQLERLQQLAGQYQMALLEDASEALGALYDGKPCGSWGDMGVLSFNGNKIITSGGGGMLLCREYEQAAEAKHLSTQARTDGLRYVHDQLGYNYRLSNLHAALGLAQLEQLDTFVLRRSQNAYYYRTRLGELPELTFQEHDPLCQPNHWLFSLVSPDKEALMQALLEKEIQCRSLWTPMHQLQMHAEYSFWQREQAVAQSARLFEGGISLPSSASLNESQLDQVCEEIERFAKQ
ncbi:MAG: aminotransferase class I/II-fold pyridoxal phosphate-dependent enzyme [Bacteroidota bacterium]